MFNQLVEDLDAVFHALAHDTRRGMLRRLAAGELTVGELTTGLRMSLTAASKHVKVLESAGLVERTVKGRRHVCRLRVQPLFDATAWLRFYEGDPAPVCGAATPGALREPGSSAA